MKKDAGIVNCTSVGLVFAGSALFVLGFRLLVDCTPPTPSQTLREAAENARSAYQQVTSLCFTIPSPPQNSIYAYDRRTESWVKQQLSSSSVIPAH
jgi:hypothetical protein